MLSEIKVKLGNLVADTWQQEMTTWGDAVALYGQYYDGDHRIKLTDEMRKMLQIADSRTENFNDNYCEMIVDTMSDRLTVSSIEGDNATASAWAADVLDFNRFDGLQMDVHQAAVRDGDTFVMVAFDNTAQKPTLVHEPAWDGDTGMLVVYDRTRKHILVAIKVWREGDARYVNMYWPDRIDRFTWNDGGPGNPAALAEREVDEPDWTAGVIPVVHFRNQARTKKTLGISALKAVIPLQDALNRTLNSMIMTGELTAFGLRWAKGFKPPADLAPGKWVYWGVDAEAARLAATDAGMMEQGEIVPFINQARFLIDQMGTVSRTPLPGFMGDDDASGEALKQRETFLLGKIGKFQTKNGNAWEDMMDLAVLIQAEHGTKKAPAMTRWQCRWKDAQTRNDTEVIDNAKKVADQISDMEFLRLVAPVYGWDEQKIKDIIQEKQEQSAANLRLIGLPGANHLGNTAAQDDGQGDQGQEDADAA